MACAQGESLKVYLHSYVKQCMENKDLHNFLPHKVVKI